MIDLDPRWDRNKRLNEGRALDSLITTAALLPEERLRIIQRAEALVTRIRGEARPGLMEVFLAEYGLSTEEGIALMCLAEALLRVPDAETIDALIEDKIAPSDWGRHLGRSASSLVNASTWGLMLTGRVLKADAPGVAGHLRHAVRRLGEPVIRSAVGRAMREMGRQFVLGQDIVAAMDRARTREAEGYTYSYDMLGEAAMTADDAARYADAYTKAIAAIARRCRRDVRGNPGISVKLSALHPRYEVAKTERVMAELVPALTGLARQAAKANMGFNIDAEEADRLSVSMKVVEAVLADPELAGWDGFGVVVQAYGRRAPDVLDGLYDLAGGLDRRIMVRLVKGAYWDTEIKHAQVEGLAEFPVFTRKAATDVSYIANARKLLGMTDRIYPQFATHNAHTVAAVLEMAEDIPREHYELQRLHGMGAALHDIVLKGEGTRCRIYAPVGAHRDLLAYLVRRLLENGANSSFVNQIVDEAVPPSVVAACPFDKLARGGTQPRYIRTGPDLFEPARRNSAGFDLHDATELARIAEARQEPLPLLAEPILAGPASGTAPAEVFNPATGVRIGEVVTATADDVAIALSAARPWNVRGDERARVLRRASDLYEANFGQIFAVVAQEAGKTLADAVGELREAVDFLRYYASQAETLDAPGRGLFSCISPWNFPLAIFTGQIAAALAAGNGVLAKPAEATPIIATLAVRLMHQAGVPASALQLLPGEGAVVGHALSSDPRINGVAFTGSTATARRIQSAMAEHLAPGTPLIAETGGLNAMIVDSTALPEQAVRDIVTSAFQSAGQRCSALRCLYVQEDTEPVIRRMLIGAMDELTLGDPWAIETDIGPVITADARDAIADYIAVARSGGRVLHELETPGTGNFVGPTLIRVNGIEDLEREVFGPVLHLATFGNEGIGNVVEAINAAGYGLTFGLHSRIDGRVQEVADRVHAGNLYVNRNQIGAIVGSQPFGGEGLSGTGPKAGGPNYVTRFSLRSAPGAALAETMFEDTAALAEKIARAAVGSTRTSVIEMPGPTGETNRLTLYPRGPILCLGPGAEAAAAQASAVQDLGGIAVKCSRMLEARALETLPDLAGVIWWGDPERGRDYARALARRDGPIIPLITDVPDVGHATHERHLCVDTTAAGGNTKLLAGSEVEARHAPSEEAAE